MRVIVACEESQAVTKAFRERGHEAYSCDIKECTGGFPEWHYMDDIFNVLKKEKQFDLMIAHPPCTFLSVSGSGWLYNKDGTKNEERFKNQFQALNFVKSLMNADIKRIAIENPISVISTHIREPDQIIQPFQFGDSARKSTCLWLKNLPYLIPTKIVDPGEKHFWIDKKTGKRKSQPLWYYRALLDAKTPEERRTIRSKTFRGISEAMADQWGNETRLNRLGNQLTIF